MTLPKEDELVHSILELKKKRNAVILAHNYQRDEVQSLADYCGDSLGLSIEATKTDAEVIVFCGVHFMAETAYVLSPEKTVILPRMDAGCPMADMITSDDLRRVKKDIPDSQIVCYVNSSAEVKAESDICCTSANAVKVASSLDSKKIFMVPDKNLAQYVASRCNKEISYWDGYCHVHNDLSVEEVTLKKEKLSGLPFIAHPECTPEALNIADHICSTSGMYQHIKNSNETEFIIGTEMGILYRLKKENPGKTFHLASNNLICPNMKITRLIDIFESLSKMNNIVTVDPGVAKAAKTSLDRMLKIPRDS